MYWERETSRRFCQRESQYPGDAGRIQKDAKPGKTREPGKKDQNYI